MGLIADANDAIDAKQKEKERQKQLEEQQPAFTCPRMRTITQT